jgi:hypothetical protein
MVPAAGAGGDPFCPQTASLYMETPALAVVE